MLAAEPLRLDQIGDQQVNLVDVVAQIVLHGVVFHELQLQLGAGDRRAQFVADGQQQLPLGFQHGLQGVGHVVDAVGQLSQLVGAPAADPVVQLTGADALGPLAQQPHRLQQAPHQPVVEEQHDDRQRQPHVDHQVVVVAQRGHLAVEKVLVAAARHANHILIAHRHHLRFLGQGTHELGAADVQIVGFVRLPVDVGAADDDRQREVLGQLRGLAQVRGYADAVDDLGDVVEVELRNGTHPLRAPVLVKLTQGEGHNDKEEHDRGGEDQQQAKEQ